MDSLYFDNMRKIWKRVVKSSDDGSFSFNTAIYRKMLNLFHVGPFYYYVFNCGTADFEYLDEQAAVITGYPQDVLSPRFIYGKVHPEDLAYVINFEDRVTSFYEQLPIGKRMSYKTSYDYRVLRADGHYIRLLQQVTAIQVGEDGSVYRTFGVHTDITHLKPEGKPILNFVGLDGEPTFSDSETKGVFEARKPLLTKRELEIVKLISEGYTTVRTADMLCISVNTVHTHRRNIMAKTKAGTPAELVRIAVASGWL